MLDIANFFKDDIFFSAVDVHSMLAKFLAEVNNGTDSAISWCNKGIEITYLDILYNGGADLDSITEILNLKYLLVEFKLKEANLIDLIYIAQKPCKIILNIEDRKIQLEVKAWKQHRYVLCQGENIAI